MTRMTIEIRRLLVRVEVEVLTVVDARISDKEEGGETPLSEGNVRVEDTVKERDSGVMKNHWIIFLGGFSAIYMPSAQRRQITQIPTNATVMCKSIQKNRNTYYSTLLNSINYFEKRCAPSKIDISSHGFSLHTESTTAWIKKPTFIFPTFFTRHVSLGTFCLVLNPAAGPWILFRLA